MKQMLILLTLLIFLPVAAIAITEGVVESAPDVSVEIGEMTDALFGAWEQGLSDIRAAAVREARKWKQGIGELSLERMTLHNSPMDKDSENDELRVHFIYLTEERRNARLTVRYVRGTGELIEIRDTLDGGGEKHAGTALSDLALENIAHAQLAKYAGTQDATLSEGDSGENPYRWIARFATQTSVYEVCLDRQTGEVIRVSLYVKGEIM